MMRFLIVFVAAATCSTAVAAVSYATDADHVWWRGALFAFAMTALGTAAYTRPRRAT